MSAKLARKIRRGCQVRSGNRIGIGVSELFTAPADHAEWIISAKDLRLKRYLLGY